MVLMHKAPRSLGPVERVAALAERMRKLGKGELLKYLECANEDHSLVRYGATICDRLQRMQNFYGTHIGTHAR